MLVNTAHLVAGMKLERDIELKAGSYLITSRELGDGTLSDKVIESIQKFSGQIVPERDKIFIANDKLALGHIKKILDKDLKRIADEVVSGKTCPNFLADIDLQGKVLEVMEVLFSNPDIIHLMYDARFNSGKNTRPLNLILDHSIRTALLSVACGLRMRWTTISLLSIGIAALLHDMGIIQTSVYPNLDSIDDLTKKEVSDFIERHQLESALLFRQWQENMTPYQKGEVFHILANHHHPDPRDSANRNTFLFHFADLVDEMISHLPHRLRYNFTPPQLEIIGQRYAERSGLISVFLALNKLYKNRQSPAWEIISNLAGLFRMQQVLSGDYEEKLREIIAMCPFDSAETNPPLGGDEIPRSIYCRKSLEPGFSCPHMIFSKVEIQTEKGEMKEFLKCGTLGNSLQRLNEKNAG
jgi:hypothetical protein